MRFERSMMVVGLVATALLAAAGGHAYATAADALDLHLLLALGAMMAAALPHLWAIFYLAGTRRALARETGDAATGRRAAAAAAAVAALAALAAAGALAVTGARAYVGTGGGLHGPLFWGLLAVQPAALWIEWRALAENARRLARHGG